ncbi:MAG: nitrate/nitrite transporter NrtS [Spirochaetaceae bacterium]|nr:nitrate/nitrite transporter NrtS [Spirochaetaceae bacterium]
MSGAEPSAATHAAAVPRPWLEMAFEPSVVRRSLRVAAVVGTILVTINYADRILAGVIGRGDVLKMMLTYCVPYCVSTHASVQSIRSFQRATATATPAIGGRD